MRHVRIEDLKPLLTKKWKKEALDALTDLKKLKPEDRSKAIAKQSKVWSSLRKKLERLSAGKCWYCESRELRSDKPVDHFRPKGAVHGVEGSEGYWWLAFDWQNYRLSCIFCNSRRIDVDAGTAGGKWDFFPLFDEATRATTPEADIHKEEVVLLDPTKATDPGLLTFDEDGTPKPRYDKTQDRDKHYRATQSIKLYHLHHVDAVDVRRKIAARIKTLIADGAKYFGELARPNNSAKHGLHRVMQDLIDLTARESEFSSAARAFLYGYQTIPWIAEILQIR